MAGADHSPDNVVQNHGAGVANISDYLWPDIYHIASSHSCTAVSTLFPHMPQIIISAMMSDLEHNLYLLD